MAIEPSSRDLHPKTGARFVFDRVELEPAPVYAVVIYLPDARGWKGTLRWVDGHAELEPAPGEVSLAADSGADDELRRAGEETLKLARVLHRDPKPHMVRWRG